MIDSCALVAPEQLLWSSRSGWCWHSGRCRKWGQTLGRPWGRGVVWHMPGQAEPWSAWEQESKR